MVFGFGNTIKGHRLRILLLYVCIYLSVCPQEMDMGYGIPWGNTTPGESLLQSCGAGYTGKCIHKELNVV